MPQKVTLDAETREDFGKNAMRRIRSQGRIPAVVYGIDMDESISVTLDTKEFATLIHHHNIDTTLVLLEVKGAKKASERILIREVQKHPFKEEILHADLMAVSKGHKLTIEVPLVLEGNPIGVKQHSGVMQQVMHTLSISVLPSKIPDHITIEIDHLEIGDSIQVEQLPEGDYEILADPSSTIVNVMHPQKVEEEVVDEDLEEIEGEDGEPEVIGKGGHGDEDGEKEEE